jgi:hypothetical protein
MNHPAVIVLLIALAVVVVVWLFVAGCVWVATRNLD